MSRFLLSISAGDGRPIYRQIVEGVKAAMAAGKLREGDKLPTHRELARELVVAPLTVKKAYDLLQSEGWITMAQGRGTFVADGPAGAGRDAKEELTQRVQGLVRQARIMGLTAEEVKALIGRQWNQGD